MEVATPSPSLDVALIEAAKALNIEQVQRLLGDGACPKFKHDPEGVWGSRDSYTALHVAILAAQQGGNDMDEATIAVILALIAAGAEVNATRESYNWKGTGDTCTAFELVLPQALKNATLMNAFLDAKADPNTKSTRSVHSMRTDGFYEHFVLHTAVKSGTVKVVSLLLGKQANVDALSREVVHNERGHNQDRKESALHMACRRHDVKMCALLLAHMANVNASMHYLEHIEQKGSEHDDPRSEALTSSIVVGV